MRWAVGNAILGSITVYLLLSTGKLEPFINLCHRSMFCSTFVVTLLLLGLLVGGAIHPLAATNEEEVAADVD